MSTKSLEVSGSLCRRRFKFFALCESVTSVSFRNLTHFSVTIMHPVRERKCSRAVMRLSQQFPGDPGAMAPFFLNYLLIAPGESFFMAANEPHAYVAGEIIECMACSDNVVRAGLTPKFKDVDNLVNMLTYSMGGPNIDGGAYSTENPDVIRYSPPCPEFEVMILTVEPGKQSTFKNPGVPVIMIILEGSGDLDGKLCRPGRSYYWPANSGNLRFTVDSTKRGSLKVAMAHKNLHLDRPTSINREDFGGASSSHFLSVPTSPRLPYMGLGGTTPVDIARTIVKVESMDYAEQAVPSL